MLTENGDLLTRKYQLGRLLGRGGFASCFELRDVDSLQTYAAKVVLKPNLQHTHNKQKLLAEIELHKSLQHPGVVCFERSFEDSERVYLLMELCADNLQDVLQRRQRLSELEVQNYTSQLVSTLQYLHSCGVVHRDLKLANLFLTTSMVLKLGDFGLASRIRRTGERRRTVCGTPNYIAPEVLDPQVGHSFQVDLWSLGALIYTLIVGFPPFETDDTQVTYSRIRQAAYSFPDCLEVSQASKDLIAGLLEVDPAKRLTLAQVQSSSFLNPPYIIPSSLPTSSLHSPLSTSFVERAKSQLLPPPDPLKFVPCEDTVGALCVRKWLNLSTKYGLGYVLSNGVMGVSFNDHTYLLQSAGFLIYLAKHSKPLAFPSADPPAGLAKKATLMQHFHRFLSSEIEHERPIPLLYVQKWIQARQAILFRLSSRVIQVAFRDGTQILLSADASQLTFISAQGERLNTLLDEVQPMTEVAMHLHSAQELLAQLVT